jgi:hypothetical protein
VQPGEWSIDPSRTSFDGNFGVGAIRKWARLLTDPKDAKGWPKLCPDPASLRHALDSAFQSEAAAFALR